MLERIIPYSHLKVKEYLTNESIAVDMTMGNGNDTLFLSKHAKKVFAFDIQEQAVINTQKLLEENNINNVELILDNHLNVAKYLSNADVFVFNLGYLPGSDKSITTSSENTIETIKQSLNLLNKKGLIAITVYPGHDQGEIEGNEINKFVKTLSSKNHNVLQYKFVNKKRSPYNIFIEKIR